MRLIIFREYIPDMLNQIKLRISKVIGRINEISLGLIP